MEKSKKGIKMKTEVKGVVKLSAGINRCNSNIRPKVVWIEKEIGDVDLKDIIAVDGMIDDDLFVEHINEIGRKSAEKYNNSQRKIIKQLYDVV